jgi:hypothetical protein
MTDTITITRAEYYEMLVECLARSTFVRMFGCEPADIYSFDYDFSNVEWNLELECAYQEYLESC